MKTIATIKKLCESGIEFTEEMMLEEIKQRISKKEIISTFFERGMSIATTEEERKCVVSMIIDFDEDIKEIFAIYLYYKLRNIK
jgi:hypothetical protein